MPANGRMARAASWQVANAASPGTTCDELEGACNRSCQAIPGALELARMLSRTRRKRKPNRHVLSQDRLAAVAIWLDPLHGNGILAADATTSLSLVIILPCFTLNCGPRACNARPVTPAATEVETDVNQDASTDARARDKQLRHLSLGRAFRPPGRDHRRRASLYWRHTEHLPLDRQRLYRRQHRARGLAGLGPGRARLRPRRRQGGGRRSFVRHRSHALRRGTAQCARAIRRGGVRRRHRRRRSQGRRHQARGEAHRARGRARQAYREAKDAQKAGRAAIAASSPTR